MMEAGDEALGDDFGDPFNPTVNRRILSKGEVRAGLAVVAGVSGHQPSKICLAKHDHLVGALAPR